jgi:pimeloyl-ACP methyl ester carboxylesterase
MLHGFLSSSLYFRRFRKRFETEYTVITIDLLGSGASMQPDEPVTYEAQIAVLHEVLQKIETPFTMLGHSMGAVLAARYACEHSARVSRLILFNPPLFTTPQQARKSIEQTGLHYRATVTHPRSRLLWKGLKVLPRTPRRIAPPLNFGDGLRTHYYAREGGYRNIIIKAEFVHDLKRLTQPTLLIVGKRDRYVYQETLRTLSLPKNITVTKVATGHHTIIAKPKLAEELVRSYLLQ